MIILIIIVVCCYFYFDKRKFDKSNYKIESGNTYFNTRFNAGNNGEFLTFSKLERISRSSKIVTNVYLPKEDGTTTEIDLVLIHETGIYVFESKNYGGWIFGNEKSKYWTQTFKTGRKEQFYNPIWQNNTHVKHLKTYLPDIADNIFQSIIVFSERCTLKRIEIYSQNIKVINRYKLNSLMDELIRKNGIALTSTEVDDIYRKLKIHTNKSRDFKQKHIESINLKS